MAPGPEGIGGAHPPIDWAGVYPALSDDTMADLITRRINAEVQVNSWASGLMLQQAQAHGQQGRYSNRWWSPPDVGKPVLGFKREEWRGFTGGLTFALHTPETRRVVAMFTDPAIARLVYSLETTQKRSLLYLTHVDGCWFASFKYKVGRPAHDATGGHGGRLRKRHKRRWFAAPADWPRDSRGRPMSDRVAARWRAEHLARDTGGQ